METKIIDLVKLTETFSYYNEQISEFGVYYGGTLDTYKNEDFYEKLVEKRIFRVKKNDADRGGFEETLYQVLSLKIRPYCCTASNTLFPSPIVWVIGFSHQISFPAFLIMA